MRRSPPRVSCSAKRASRRRRSPRHGRRWGSTSRWRTNGCRSAARGRLHPASSLRSAAPRCRRTPSAGNVYFSAPSGGLPTDAGGVNVQVVHSRDWIARQQVASDSRDKGGTGLGLAICRSIAIAHGGRIWADSRQGAGSVFNVSIPLPAAASSSPHAERTILLCHEEGNNMMLVASMLARHGLHTVSASSPQELCRRAAATHPDAVIFDLDEKSEEGWRIVERLKACDATREIPIIVAAMHDPASGPESIDEHAKLIAGPDPAGDGRFRLRRLAEEEQHARAHPADRLLRPRARREEQERLRLGPTEFLIKSRA